MSLVFSAFVPHPPIIIPQIGKENLKKIDSTVKAYGKLASELEKSKAETILIISPHGEVQNGSFTMNLAPNFTCNFEDFGDFSTKKSWPGDIVLAYKIREKLETTAPLQLVSTPVIDHGTSIPLFMLTQNIPKIKIIPLYYSGLDLDAHFKFGQLLKRELLIQNKKIAVIASGDLSHRITENAPAGYSPKGKKFDKKIVKYLSEKKTSELLDIDKNLILEAGECGLRSILIQQGIMDNIKHSPQVLSYEYPFGIGYLTINFRL